MNKKKILNLVDANGKKFDVNVTDMLNSISVEDLEEGRDLSIYDNEKPLTNEPIFTIVDSEDKPFDITAITDSNESKKIIGLEVLVETTHSGENANYVRYNSDSMEKDCETMMAPYAKPFIRNHDTYTDPIGRVSNSYFGPSELVDRDTINVLFKVTEKEAIEKFLDGRYRTVSIGASPGHVTCDICGKDILKDGTFKFCGHWKGETYAGKKAVWSCRDLVYSEVSVVNNPADKWAQVKRIKVLQAEDKNLDTKVGDSKMEDETVVVVEDNEDKSTNLVDDILNLDNEPADPEVTPSDENKQNDEEDNGEAKTKEDDNTDAEPEKTVEDYQAEIQTITDENEAYKNEIADLKAKQIEISDELVASEAESKSSRDQSLRLAVKYKELLVDSIKTINVVVKRDLTDEELLGKSIKDLGVLAEDMKKEIPLTHTTPTAATNPGVVDNKEPNVITDEEENKTTKTRTKDYASILNSLIDSVSR